MSNPNRSFDTSVVNPYAVRRQPSEFAVNYTGRCENGFSTCNNNKNRATMGIQSQRRDGAIRACKRKATKAKHKVERFRSFNGPFHPLIHCSVCKAQNMNSRGQKV